MARIHRLTKNQPKSCHIDQMKDRYSQWFKTQSEAESYCQEEKISYKGCRHCLNLMTPWKTTEP